MTWELRWHPFRGEWVLFTAHRGARPWIGETIGDDEPDVPEDNALGPLGRRIATTNPDYRGVFVFTNDLPVFSPEAPEPTDGDDLYRTQRAVGTAEVVCYHHDPTRSMADLDDDEVTAVVHTWRAAPARCRHSTAWPTCSSSRTAAPRSARPTRTRTARSTPAPSSTARWRAKPRSPPSTVSGRGGRCSWTSSSVSAAVPGWSATVTTASRACVCLVLRATHTSTCSRAGR